MKAKYQKVEDFFIEKINNGILKAGDKLSLKLQSAQNMAIVE